MNPGYTNNTFNLSILKVGLQTMFSVVIHYLQLYTRLLSAAIRVCIMQLILRTPFISNRHKKFSEELLFIPREDFQCTLFNWEFLKSILRSERCGFNKLAHLNCPAPICDMVSLDGKTPHRLYEVRCSRTIT